jgi:hypothetical protein
MIEEATRILTKGLTVDRGEYIVRAERIEAGRFSGESDLDIYLKAQLGQEHLLFIKTFAGRKPFLKQWAEFYGVRSSVVLGGTTVHYFDSALETKLLGLFSESLTGGESLYVEYYGDEESRRQLEAGVPPAASRIGYKLLNLGFTWFKDWYFPEGFMEGGQKLQGEKPLNDEARQRHAASIRGQLTSFLEKTADAADREPQITKARDRAEHLLRFLK